MCLCVTGGWCWTPTLTILFLCTQMATRSFLMSNTLLVQHHPVMSHTNIDIIFHRASVGSTTQKPSRSFCLLVSLDGNFLAVASHDNFIYIYAVTENGRKYSRVGKCTVSRHQNFKIQLFSIQWSFRDKTLMHCVVTSFSPGPLQLCYPPGLVQRQPLPHHQLRRLWDTLL